MLPADLIERLAKAVAGWDNRDTNSQADTTSAGHELASAAMAALVWDSNEGGKS